MIYSDDGSTKGTNIEQYYFHIVKAFEKAGYEARPGPKLKQYFEEAGFVDIHVQKYRIPMGTWPKDKYYVCFPSYPQSSTVQKSAIFSNN